MDGDGALVLPRNVAKKSSTSPGRVETSKRLLSPNIKNTNPKKRKSLNVSSNRETFHFANNSSNDLETKDTSSLVIDSQKIELQNEESQNVKSENVVIKNDENQTFDISSVSENSQHSICEIYDHPVDNNQICNKTNKRLVKNTKYVDFITDNEIDKIVRPDAHCKKSTRKPSKHNKSKSFITSDVINLTNQDENVISEPLVTTKIKTESNELSMMPGKSSSRKKRKKLSVQNLTDITPDVTSSTDDINSSTLNSTNNALIKIESDDGIGKKNVRSTKNKVKSHITSNVVQNQVQNFNPSVTTNSETGFNNESNELVARKSSSSKKRKKLSDEDETVITVNSSTGYINNLDLTNNDLEKIESDEGLSKKNTRSSKSYKAKSHKTSNVIQNPNPLVTKFCETTNESNKLNVAPGKKSSSKKRKKLSDEFSESVSNQNLINSTLDTSADIEQLNKSNKQINTVNKNKRKSGNNKKTPNKSLTDKQPNPEIIESAPVVNSNNEQLINSNITNNTKSVTGNSHPDLSENNGNKRSTRSKSSRSTSSHSTSSHTTPSKSTPSQSTPSQSTPSQSKSSQSTRSRSKTARFGTETARLKKENNNYTTDNSDEFRNQLKENVEKNVKPLVKKFTAAKDQGDSSEMQEQSENCDELENVKPFDPNVYDSTLLEIKTEEEDYSIIESEQIETIDLEDIKSEELSPCSPDSSLSELFLPIRDCHIHLERLCIDSQVSKEVNVVNSFNKFIPICRCKGEVIGQKLSKTAVGNNVVVSDQGNVVDSAQENVVDSAQKMLVGSASKNVDSAQENVADSVQQNEKTSAQQNTKHSAQQNKRNNAQKNKQNSAQHNVKNSAQHKKFKCLDLSQIESIPTSSNSSSNTTEQMQDNNSASVNIKPIVPENIEVPVQSKESATSIIKSKIHKRKYPNKPPPLSILSSHASEVIENVIKSYIIESPKIGDAENQTPTKNVDPSSSTEAKLEEDLKNSSVTSLKSEIKLPAELKDVSAKNVHTEISNKKEPKTKEDIKKSTQVSFKKELNTHSTLKEKQVLPKTQSNSSIQKTLKASENVNQATISTSLLYKITPPPEKKFQLINIKPPQKNLNAEKLKTSHQKIELSFSSLTNINKTPEKISCTSDQKIKTPPQKIQPSIKSINNPPQKVLFLPRNLESTSSLFEIKKNAPRENPENLDTPGININTGSANSKKSIVDKLDTKPSDEKTQNIKKITVQLDEVNIKSGESSTTNKTVTDLRQILSNKRMKEKSNLEKYENLVIQSSSNSKKVVLQNPKITFNSGLSQAVSKESNIPLKTLKISPNKSTIIQLKRSPINKDNIRKIFNENISNEGASSSESKTIKSPEIKINILGKTIIRSNSESLAHPSPESQFSDVVTQKLNKIYSDQQQEKIAEQRKSKFQEATQELFDDKKVEPLQVIIDNDVTLESSSVSLNESLQTDTDIELEESQPAERKPVISTPNISQDKSDHFVFAKPKHTFKFIEKCEVKRPPSRTSSGKIRLNRPILNPMHQSPSTSSFQAVFKAPPVYKKTLAKPKRYEPSTRYNNDDDVISILADTTGLDSVCDAASVRNDNSDDEDDFKIDEVYMDEERFTQVKDWLSQSVEEPVSVPELVVSPIKKISEIPVARVNPGIQKINSEEISPVTELNIEKRVSIKFPQEETKREEKRHEEKKHEEKKHEEKKHKEKEYEEKKHKEKEYEEKKIERPIELDMFRNVCHGKFRNDYCPRKKCYFAHTLPSNWQNTMKSLPVDDLMRIYKYVKDCNYLHFYQILLSLVASQLGFFKDFNNLTNLVKDVLEINMNTDREPLIKTIIQALIDNGFSFYSTVEIIFRSANVEQDLKYLLCDILLNLTVERRLLEDDWPIIQMLSVYKKFDIDKGIIQFIIIEALAKNYLQKELVFKVYNDLIKRVPDFNMKNISATLCQKFIDLLRKYSLQSDADELFSRCVLLHILEKPNKKIDEHRNITKTSSIQQQDDTKSKCSTNDTKSFDFPPPLIKNHFEQSDYSKYQVKQEHSPVSGQNQNQYQPQSIQSLNRPPSHPQQELANQYQPEQINSTQQQNLPQMQYQPTPDHQNRSTNQPNQDYPNRPPSHPHQQEHHSNQNFPQNLYEPHEEHPKNALQNQDHTNLTSNQFQLHQEHEMHRSKSNYKKNPKHHPLLPGLRADKAIIDQQNYAQYFNHTQQAIKSYTTQPSTSNFVPAIQESSITQMIANNPQAKKAVDDLDRFLNYSTENLELLASTATQNLMEIAREGDSNKSPNLKTYPFNFLADVKAAADQIQPPLVERQPVDFLATSMAHNFPEVKQFVAEENFVAIMQLIIKYKEGKLTDVFLSHLIDALIVTPHNYPTFFCNLSDMSAITNDVGLNYMMKTVGVNLVLHLCQNNQYDPAFRINHILTMKYKSNDFYDIYNCKIYLKNKYSFFRRILIIAQMYIVKGDITTSWNMLRDNALSCGNYWQSNYDEADIKYRDFVLAKLFECFKKIKNSSIGLDALLYLMKYKSTDINIREHANSILVNAINNRCNFDKIVEFMSVSPDWYKYLDKNTIRAILVNAYLERRDCVSNLYEIAYKLRICPQLMGNEQMITLSGHYHYAELQLYLDKYFQNMIKFLPITANIIINFSLNEELTNDEIPLLMHQYNSSKSVLAARVVNILENMMKPPIKVLNRNNCLYLDPESVNTHLIYRQQSSL